MALKYKDTYTVTFGGQVENHVGMQKIGKMEDEGFTIEELEEAKLQFESQGCECVIVNLSELCPEELNAAPAAVLIIRNGVKLFADPDKLYSEQASLEWDTKYKDRRRNKVLNKHARYNLCYADFDQAPDYEEGNGRVVSFESLPLLSEVRKYLQGYLGEKTYGENGEGIYAEGNYYHNPSKCGIGFHGDAERKIVIALRLGETYPLEYQWYDKSQPVGKRMHVDLHHGDMYVMSEKASGWDWKTTKNGPTLRHAAGCDKYLYPGGKPSEIVYVA